MSSPFQIIRKGRKFCSRCVVEKELSEFHASNKNISGYRSECRSCRSKDYQRKVRQNLRKELSSLRYQERKEKFMNGELLKPLSKRCRICKSFLPAEMFYDAPLSKDGLMSACKKCHNQEFDSKPSEIKPGKKEDIKVVSVTHIKPVEKTLNSMNTSKPKQLNMDFEKEIKHSSLYQAYYTAIDSMLKNLSSDEAYSLLYDLGYKYGMVTAVVEETTSQNESQRIEFKKQLKTKISELSAILEKL